MLLRTAGFWLALAVLLMLAGGCTVYDEFTALESDGSGVVEFRIAWPESIAGEPGFEAHLDDLLIWVDELPGLRLQRHEVMWSDEMLWADGALEFSALEALEPLGTRAAEELGVSNQLSIFEDSLGRVIFVRILDLSDELTEAAWLDGEPEWTIRTAFPGDVMVANTIDEHIDQGAGRVRWVFSAADLRQVPQKMRVVMARPFDREGMEYLWYTGFVILMIAVWLYRVRSRLRARLASSDQDNSSR